MKDVNFKAKKPYKKSIDSIKIFFFAWTESLKMFTGLECIIFNLINFLHEDMLHCSESHC